MQIFFSVFDGLDRDFKDNGVATPRMEDSHMMWSGTALSLAGKPILISEWAFEELVALPEVTDVPGTKPWVLGVASYKGGQLPILDSDLFLGGKLDASHARTQMMVVDRQAYRFGLTISGVLGTPSIPTESRMMDHPIDVALEPYCLGGFEVDGQFMPVFDLDRLIESADFSNAAAVGAP